MTLPCIVKEGDVVLSTVRTVARFYLLRPDRELTRAVRYILAHYANKHGIVLHAACLMSTHLHLVYRDPLAQGPAFRRDAVAAIANVVKALRGWRGDVFRGGHSKVRLRTPQAILDKIGYVLANPVAVGAVRYSKDWPGLCTHVDDMGRRTLHEQRPTLYFRERGEMPESASLRFELPEELVQGYGEDATREAIHRSVKEHEQAAHQAILEKGWTYRGADRCKTISPYARATAYEVFGARNPHFATKGGGMKAFFEAVEELRAFRTYYKTALARWKEGHREVVFPHGTYLIRVLHGVCADPAPG